MVKLRWEKSSGNKGIVVQEKVRPKEPGQAQSFGRVDKAQSEEQKKVLHQTQGFKKPFVHFN